MNFGGALEALKAGQPVARAVWTYTTQRVYYQAGYPDGIGINNNTAAATGLPEGTVLVFNPYLMYSYPDGSCSPWLPTHEDLLADDWVVAPAPATR